MACASRYEFGLFGSLYFIAVVIGSLLFAPLGDIFGRKWIVTLGLSLCAVAQTATLVSPNKEFTYALIFLQGLSMPMRAFVGYVYAMEFLPLKKTQVCSAILMGFDGQVLVVAALWFLYVSKNWKTLWLMATLF